MLAGDRLADWLGRLVQIPSVAPDQAGPRAGVPGEARLAREVARWFGELGGRVTLHEVLPGRPNVYGVWRGRSARWAALDAHMDTVGVEQMPGDPFSGHIQGGRVHGRGAVDTKASLAVVLALLEAMHQRDLQPEPNLLIAATVDEEVNAQGAPAFARWLQESCLTLDQLVVAEPTGCAPIYGHKGVARVEFRVRGKATHSSQPELGQNAIVAAAHLVLALAEEHARLRATPPATALGSASLTVSLMHGGQGLNLVPDACTVSVDRRVVAGESSSEVSAALIQLARRSCPLPLTPTVLQAIDAFLQPPDSPWIRQLAAWSGQAPGVAPYGSNAWFYGQVARDCAVLGPGSIAQAHGAEEWVAISELEKLADIYAHWWGILDLT